MSQPRIQLETCANCGRTIGNLETPHLHNDRIICAECSARFGVQGLKHISRTNDEIPVAPTVQVDASRRGKGKFLRRTAALLIVLGATACWGVPKLDLHQDNASIIFIAGVAALALGVLMLFIGLVRGLAKRAD